MTESQAAGRKTALVGVSGRLQTLIEDQVASLTDGVCDCLVRARVSEPKNDFDVIRTSERRDAVQMVSATAELLGAIAKLKGEFTQTHHVMHSSDPPPAEKSGSNDSGRKS